jgi:hypothetical protein
MLEFLDWKGNGEEGLRVGIQAGVLLGRVRLLRGFQISLKIVIVFVQEFEILEGRSGALFLVFPL